MKLRSYCVYILGSESGVLYVGITNDLPRRIKEHKQKRIPEFTSRYNSNRLVYYEEYVSPRDAIAREKQIKGYRREKKVRLIVEENPGWRDRSLDWT